MICALHQAFGDETMRWRRSEQICCGDGKGAILDYLPPELMLPCEIGRLVDFLGKRRAV